MLTRSDRTLLALGVTIGIGSGMVIATAGGLVTGDVVGIGLVSIPSCLFLGVCLGVSFMEHHRQGAPLSEGGCPECGYDMTNLPATRCPECGHDTALDDGATD